MDIKPKNLTILAASSSHQSALPYPASNSQKGGIFTGELFKGLGEGKDVNKSFKEAQTNVPNLAYELYPGVRSKKADSLKSSSPVSYGPEIPKQLFDPNKTNNKGVALIVEGKERSSGEVGIKDDVAKAETMYKKMGLDVSVVKTPDELKSFESSLKERGDKHKDDIFIQHVTGHAAFMKSEKPNKGENELASKTLPDMKNMPEREGVFEMSAGENSQKHTVRDGTALIHEDNLTSPLFTASKYFSHSVGIIDTCAAGSFDNVNTTKNMSETIPIDPDKIIQNTERR